MKGKGKRSTKTIKSKGGGRRRRKRNAAEGESDDSESDDGDDEWRGDGMETENAPLPTPTPREGVRRSTRRRTSRYGPVSKKTEDGMETEDGDSLDLDTGEDTRRTRVSGKRKWDDVVE